MYIMASPPGGDRSLSCHPSFQEWETLTFPRALIFVCAAVMSVLFARGADAEVQFQPVSQQELKMTTEPNAPGAPAIVLYREVNRNDMGRTGHGGAVLAGGTADRFEQDYMRVKILTEEGRKYANVEIPLPAELGTVTAINARTILPDGSIKTFDGKIFDQTIVKAKGYQYRAKTFVLPDVQVGSIIEYYYTIAFREGFLAFSQWILSDELFTKRAKFTLRPYHNDYLPMNFRWNEHLPTGSPSPREVADGTIQLEATNIPAFHAEDFMPPQNELKARVDFIYSYDSLENDASKFWKKVGKRRNDELESFISKKAALEQAVSEIVSPSDPPEAKLRKIYARVQQLHNTTYEVRKTEQEQKREGKKAEENVEDIWKQGYGDRQQLNWLFLALARSSGIEAYGVWVSDRSNSFFDPRTMQSGKLERNLVLVKLNGNDLYLEPGTKFAPFGLLPWEETGVTGLRLDKDGGSWVETGLTDSAQSRIARKADLKLLADGSLEGRLTVTYTGLEALSRRLDEGNQDDSARKIYLENEIRQDIPVAAEVDVTRVSDWTGSEPPLEAEFTLKIPGWGTVSGSRAFLPVGIFGATEKNVFEYSSRMFPIYFQYKCEKADDITVKLPSGWQISALPKPRNNDLHALVYVVSAESSPGVMHLTRKLDLNAIQLDPKYYSALRNFYQGIKAADEQQVVLLQGAVRSAD
jgi:transglutaminase-like putative cysteine protease